MGQGLSSGQRRRLSSSSWRRGGAPYVRLQLEFLGATTAIELLEATVRGHHVLEELQTHMEQAGEGRAAGGWSAAVASADTPWPPPRPAAGAPTRPPSARRRHSCSGLPSAVGSPSGRQAPNAPRVRRPHRTRVPPRQVGAHRRRAGRRRRVEAEESHRKGGISRGDAWAHTSAAVTARAVTAPDLRRL